MRRSDREVTDTKEIVQMLLRCTALSLAFGGETPYVVPLSFGVVQQGECLALYMHCAPEGEKLARMAADPHVAFAAYRSGPLTEAPVACGYSTDYESVCGSGVLRLVQENPDLPVVPMVDGGIAWDDSGYFMAAFGAAEVDEYSVSRQDDRIYFKSDDDVFDVLEHVLSDEEFNALPQTEAECRPYFEALPWIKAVIVYIDPV